MAGPIFKCLEGDQRNEADASARPREVRYFASLSDHDGDGAKLVPLDVRFKPLKVALFGSGDFLVLGWDEMNAVPVLALVKDDGAVRRFFDMSNGKAPVSRGSEGPPPQANAAGPARGAQEELAKASFTPYGDEVLLAFPGTMKSLQVWNALGEARTIPWHLPGGFVLHDVLVSEIHGRLVVRVQAEEEVKSEAKGDAASQVVQRIFEINSANGSLLAELLPEKASVQEVTCAANARLTAVFMGSLAGADGSTGGAAGIAAPTHLVIANAPR